MAKVEIAKKISMKALVGQVGAFIPMKEVEEKRGDKTVVKEVSDDGATAWLANVVGLARSIKTGESAYGIWTALMGDFRAIPLVGEKAKEEKQYRTGQLFLPDVALNLILPIVETLEKGAAVEVAFQIGIVANSESNFGYDYTAAFLMEPEENDPLAMLMNKCAPALEAPKTEEKVTPKTPAAK